MLANISKLSLPIIEKIEILLKHADAHIILESDLKRFFKKSYMYGVIVFLYIYEGVRDNR